MVVDKLRYDDAGKMVKVIYKGSEIKGYLQHSQNGNFYISDKSGDTYIQTKNGRVQGIEEIDVIG